MSVLIIAHAILWGSAIVASAITLRGDAHASGIILTLAYTGAMSLLILIVTAFELAKKGKIDHDA